MPTLTPTDTHTRPSDSDRWVSLRTHTHTNIKPSNRRLRAGHSQSPFVLVQAPTLAATPRPSLRAVRRLPQRVYMCAIKGRMNYE